MNVDKVNLLEYVGLASLALMSTCVVNVMDKTNMILHINSSVLTGHLLSGMSPTLRF